MRTDRENRATKIIANTFVNTTLNDFFRNGNIDTDDLEECLNAYFAERDSFFRPYQILTSYLACPGAKVDHAYKLLDPIQVLTIKRLIYESDSDEICLLREDLEQIGDLIHNPDLIKEKLSDKRRIN